jgi:transposase
MAEGKNPGGRPTKYNAELHPILIGALASLGLSDEEMAEKLNITTSTFYEWCKKYPKFSEAKKTGKTGPNDEVEATLFQKATGDFYITEETLDENGDVINTKRKQIPPSDTALIFWLKNRRPAQWRDKQEIEHSVNTEAYDKLKELYKER